MTKNIKMETEGTFDCSSAISIPSLGYRANLPASGETSIDVPAQQAGTNMRGLCAMGMYNFQIQFN
jgi:plastocyanin domain-containing protein